MGVRLTLLAYMVRSRIGASWRTSGTLGKASLILRLIAIGLAAFYAAVMIMLTCYTEPREKPDELSVMVRGFLHSIGWRAEDVAVLIAALPTAALLYYLWKRGVSIGVPACDYELVLSQPIRVSDYLQAHMAYDVLLDLVSPVTLFMVGATAVWSELFSLNRAKALSSVLALLVLASLVKSMCYLAQLASRSMEASGRHQLLRLGVLAYTAGGLAHSLLAGRPSPLLGLPFLAPSLALAYCFTLSRPFSVIVALLLASLAMLAVCFTAALKAAERAGIDYLAPWAGIRVRLERSARIPWEPSKAVAYAVLDRRSIAFIAVAPTVVLALLLAVVRLLPLGGEELFTPVLGMSCAFTVVVTILLLAALADNFAHILWIVRVYAGDEAIVLRAVREILARSTFAIWLGALAPLIVAVALLGGSLLVLGVIVLGLPVSLATSVLALWMAVKLAARRRIIRAEEASEQVAAVMDAIFLIVGLPAMALVAGICIPAVLAASGGAAWPLYASAAGLAMTPLLLRLGTRFLTDKLSEAEYAS